MNRSKYSNKSDIKYSWRVSKSFPKNKSKTGICFRKV